MRAAIKKVIALDFGRLTATGSYQLGPSSNSEAELQGTRTVGNQGQPVPAMGATLVATHRA